MMDLQRIYWCIMELLSVYLLIMTILGLLLFLNDCLLVLFSHIRPFIYVSINVAKNPDLLHDGCLLFTIVSMWEYVQYIYYDIHSQNTCCLFYLWLTELALFIGYIAMKYIVSFMFPKAITLWEWSQKNSCLKIMFSISIGQYFEWKTEICNFLLNLYK